MRRLRGAIALFISLTVASLAAHGVYRYLKTPVPATVPEAPPPHAEINPAPAPPQTLGRTIDAGMRAVTLNVDEITGGFREITPGDRVDLFAVVPIPDTPEGRVARQILSGVRVMAVGANGESGGRNAKRRAVTLAVTPTEAATLSSADPAARLRLAIRHPDDDNANLYPAMAFTPADGTHPFIPQKRNLDTLIAEGKRAMTIDIGPTDGVAGIFHPDDRVDIIVTSIWGNLALSAQEKPGETGVLRETHRNSRVLMQNIRILATDRSLAWNSGTNRPSARVTLEVTPAQAERLTVLADSKKGGSMIRLISRNPDDHRTLHTAGAELLDLISDRRPYRRVEMIRGALRKDQTFYR